MKRIIPLLLLIGVILLNLQGCSHPPIMKNCKLLGSTSKGEEIYKDCENI